jgi:shikimate dehydrogenase
MIDGQTQIYGIIGNPVRHSLSPVIHNGAFRRMGINAVYLAFEVKDLPKALEGIRGLGIRGLSVTMPFKEVILPLLDHLDDKAQRIQSVNTISNEGGTLVGYSTDGRGAIEALGETIHLPGKKVLLLGAGGAARAIAFELAAERCKVTIANRSREKGLKLAAEIGGDAIGWPLEDRKELDFDILINATSLGMHPHEGKSPIPRGVLRKGRVVMDIVYNPLATRLLQEAREAGCITIDGLEMLARQGAAQQEIWTGKRPRLDGIRKDLLQALKSSGRNRELQPRGTGGAND